MIEIYNEQYEVDQYQQGDITIKSDDEFNNDPQVLKNENEQQKASLLTPTPTSVSTSTKRQKKEVRHIPGHVQAFLWARERTLLENYEINVDDERKRVKERKKRLKIRSEE